jgi:class 3 adenylate cyclase
MEPETRYARSGDVHIAYQVAGEGDLDVVFVPSFLSNIELSWEQPGLGAFLRGMASFSRLIQFDRRGTGMSDGASAAVPLEDQLDDVSAVIEASGAKHPALMSILEGCALTLLYAASHPELVSALVLMTPQVRMVRGPGYEWALSEEERDAWSARVVATWGTTSTDNPWTDYMAADPEARRLGTRHQRLAMGPGDAAAALAMAGKVDVTDVLGSVQCPTLVLRRADDASLNVRHSRYVAERVPGARYVELPGETQVWLGDPAGATAEIEGFLTGVRPMSRSERVLATVLFTDIVSSTEQAAELGDAGWRALLERHDSLLHGEVARHRGRVVKSLGDGALAIFDGPSRAIGCAQSLREGLRELGLRARAGLHTGECELLGDGDVGGIAVHIAARIAALAGPDEILASGTVRDLSVGSPFEMQSRGEQRLKGVADPWRVYAVSP